MCCRKSFLPFLGRTGKVYPKSGYKTISGLQFLNAIALLSRREISFRAFRVYLACFSLVAIREAASRVRKISGKTDALIPTFKISELSRLTKASKGEVRWDLKLLSKASLLTFGQSEIAIQEEALPGVEEISGLVRSPSRPVPVPRAVLRFLAGEKRKSKALVAIAYMIRGLTIDRKSGEIKGKGSVKLSWVAAVSGLSERAAGYARAELIGIGWLTADTGSKQWKLNRHGAYFRINVDGPLGQKGEKAAPRRAPKFAPQNTQDPAQFAPPYKDKKTSSKEESKNQKSREPKPAGVFKIERGGPDFRAVKAENLWRFSDVESLYFEACSLGIVRSSEAAGLDFLAAAIRARGVKNGDSVRIFCGIVRKKLWHHITQAEEEHARKALHHFREKNPMRFRFEESTGNDRACA